LSAIFSGAGAGEGRQSSVKSQRPSPNAKRSPGSKRANGSGRIPLCINREDIGINSHSELEFADSRYSKLAKRRLFRGISLAEETHISPMAVRQNTTGLSRQSFEQTRRSRASSEAESTGCKHKVFMAKCPSQKHNRLRMPYNTHRKDCR
jgi:hypothetical protein